MELVSPFLYSERGLQTNSYPYLKLLSEVLTSVYKPTKRKIKKITPCQNVLPI